MLLMNFSTADNTAARKQVQQQKLQQQQAVYLQQTPAATIGSQQLNTQELTSHQKLQQKPNNSNNKVSILSI